MKVLQRGNFLVNVDYIGNSRQPVILIDDFLGDPFELVDYADRQTGYKKTSQYYPGVRAPVPAEYKASLYALLEELICRVFGWQRISAIAESQLSLVTTAPHQLLPAQRIPHVDFTDPNGLATIHYLCKPEHGGTSFYRHRYTGYELLSSSNVGHYDVTLNAEIRATGLPPPRYINGDTTQFERIANYESKFNRILIYRGALLHSGNISATFIPDMNPRTGRLTVNSFIDRQA